MAKPKKARRRNLITLKEYSKSASSYWSHRRYYAQIVTEDTISSVAEGIGAQRIMRSESEDFYDIPLSDWLSLIDDGPIVPVSELKRFSMQECGVVSLFIAKEAARIYRDRANKEVLA